MGCSEDYNPGSPRSRHFVKHMTCKKQFPLANEARRPPTLLKDFLLDDSISCSSSSGFKSLPRQHPNEPKKLVRAQTTKSNVSALRAMINAVKSIQFVKNSPSILPRSLSRRLLSRKASRTRNHNSFETASVKIAVTVKDIIRWKSFRDLQEDEERHQLPPPSPPSLQSHCSTDTASSSPSSGSKGSSWCESDFSSEWWWQGEVTGDLSNGGKNSGVGGRNFVEAKAGENANWAQGVGQAKEEGNEQNSPVSTIDEFQYEQEKDEDEEEEDDYSSLNFNESLANLERTKEKLMEKLRRFESTADDDGMNWMSSSSADDETETTTTTSSLEEYHHENSDDELESNGGVVASYEEGAFEKAWQLLDRAKGAKSWRSMEGHEEQLLLNFFTEELMAISSRSENSSWKQFVNGNVVVNGNEEEEEEIMVRKARAWLKEAGESVARSKRDACIEAMDKEGNWSKFEGKEVGLEIEAGLFDDLINGLLADILML